MATYTVHEPPNPTADRLDRADSLEFVKDGFSWLTALFPPLAYLAGRLWLAAVAYLVVVGLLVAGFQQLKVGEGWISLIVTAINLFLALEFSTLKRWDLDRQGWRTLGVVNGKSLDDCERRFLESWLPAQPAITVQGKGPASERPAHATSMLWPFGAKA